MATMKQLLNARQTLSHMSHGLGDHADGHAVPGNIARDGAPKKVTPVPHHSGMSLLQSSGAGLGGLGHATATINDGGQTIATSAAAAPLAHAYSGRPDLKSGTPAAPPVVGHKSQQNVGIESHADKCKAGMDTLASAVKC